jgi:undecaprenyl-diphosphatase
MPAGLQSLLLGVLQGLTEFLPVSSSGHLVLLQLWLGDAFAFAAEAVAFDLVLHVATLLPVLWFYRADISRLAGAPLANARYIGLIVVATLPTAVIGLLLKDTFETLFHTPRAVAGALLATGLLLSSTRWTDVASRPRREIGWGMALAIGVAQGLAITPGISRSGSTIATALLLGVDRAEAARFSFLLSIPAITGAAVLVAKDGVSFPGSLWGPLAIGFFAAAVTGYVALRWLVRLVRGGRLYRFAFYVVPVAVIAWLSAA